MNDKYIVIKREHLDNILIELSSRVHPGWSDVVNRILEGELPDAVVIRRQDIFAPPALDAYANGIRVAVIALGEGVALLDGFPDTRQEINELRERLDAKADYFHGQAVLSWGAVRKLPD